MTDPSTEEDRAATPGVSPGSLLLVLALPASGIALLVLVLGPGILFALGALAFLVAIPVLSSRIFGSRRGGAG